MIATGFPEARATCHFGSIRERRIVSEELTMVETSDRVNIT